jgi:hypothetical protein
MDSQFIIILYKDIYTAKTKTINGTINSFPDFLATLSNEQLKFYSEKVQKLVESDKYKPSSEEIQDVVLLYSYIIKELENGAPGDTIKFDDEGMWVSSLYMFITMEKFLRQGFIDTYSGFLFKGDLTFKPNEKMRNIGEGMSSTLSDAHNILNKKS